MRKKHNIPNLTTAPYSDEHDKELAKQLWQDTLIGVKPLDDSNRISPTPIKITHRKNHLSSSFNDAAFISPKKNIHGFTKIEKNLKKRIAKGKIPIEATLDLHGMRLIEAHQSFLHFVNRLSNADCRTALIITGKGKSGEGVIRRAFPNWLDSPALADKIQSYSTASIEHGGDGAFYIRLRSYN